MGQMEARILRMSRLGDVSQQKEDMKDLREDLDRLVLSTMDRAKEVDEKHAEIRGALRDMVVEVQKRLRGDVEEAERDKIEGALEVWMTSVSARKKAQEKEEVSREAQAAHVDPVPDLRDPAELLDLIRGCLGSECWIRLDFVA